MVHNNPSDTFENDQLTDLRARVVALRGSVEMLERERDRMERRRRRNLLLVATFASLAAHICLMLYLASQYRAGESGQGGQSVNYEIAILQEEELTELEQFQIEEPTADLSAELETTIDDTPAPLEPVVSAVELEASDLGATPSLGGGGGEGEGVDGLGAGGAGTSFFGIASRGTRFCYIVDVSGSMRGARLGTAKQELAQSISELPDYAFFYILLYSSGTNGVIGPPMQQGWMRARPETVNNFIAWLNQVPARGGTEPLPAFAQAYGIETTPDVIYFLTDGEIPPNVASEVGSLNRRRGVVINTIAFGNDTSQEQLRQIARESDGVYRFVPGSN